MVRVVRGLEDPAVGAVGGAALVLDRGPFGSAYAIAFNSPLLGPSRYRFSRTSGTTGSPYLGAWRRETLDAVDGFDERLPRNQDNDLAERIEARGLEVRYDAGAVVGYVAGRSLGATLRHHYSFGWWRMAQRHQGGQGLAPRHVAVVGLAAVGATLGVRGTGPPPVAAVGPPRRGRGLRRRGGHRHHHRHPPARCPPRPRPGAVPPVGVVTAPALAAAIDAGWALGLVRGRLGSPRQP